MKDEGERDYHAPTLPQQRTLDAPTVYRNGADTPVVRKVSAGRNRQISRMHAALAAENLLREAHGEEVGAVRVTDGVGFDWNRWMENVVHAHELRGAGVSEAYVVRRALEHMSEFMFVRRDGSTVAISPKSQMYDRQYRCHGIVIFSKHDEIVHGLLRSAPDALQAWQCVRRQPPGDAVN